MVSAIPTHEFEPVGWSQARSPVFPSVLCELCVDVLSLTMARRLTIFGLGFCVLACSGCYERVVSSRGLGSATVQEPYRSNTAADRYVDSMFGPPPKTFKSADNTPLQGHSRWTSDSTGGGIKAPMPTPGSAQGASSGN